MLVRKRNVPSLINKILLHYYLPIPDKDNLTDHPRTYLQFGMLSHTHIPTTSHTPLVSKGGDLRGEIKCTYGLHSRHTIVTLIARESYHAQIIFVFIHYDLFKRKEKELLLNVINRTELREQHSLY